MSLPLLLAAYTLIFPANVARGSTSGQTAVTRAGVTPADWSMYMRDPSRSNFNPVETAINVRSVGSLRPWWIHRIGGTISTQTIRVGDMLYWGSWDGFEHESRASDGNDVWSTFIGRERNTNCSPPELGVGSSAAFAVVPIHNVPTRVIYVAGGNGTFYALKATTGTILWRRFLGPPQKAYFVWTSPVVYKGSVYMGLASIGDCPSTPGKVLQFNASNGAIEHTLNVVPSGCTGGDVWGSFALDEATGKLYVPTGNSASCHSPEPLAQALLELRASDLSVLGHWQIPQVQAIKDSDFGSTPTLFTATIGGIVRKMVGVVNKNGRYYAFERGRISRGPVWYTSPFSGSGDTIAPSPWDGKHLYVAAHWTRMGGHNCEASVHALDPATGDVVWKKCLWGGAPEGAVSAVPGLIFVGIGSKLMAMDSHTGRIVFKFQDTSYHWFYSPPSISGGVLYVANSDGRLYAFVPGTGAR